MIMMANGKFGQNAEVTPLLFSKDILGFLMTTDLLSGVL